MSSKNRSLQWVQAGAWAASAHLPIRQIQVFCFTLLSVALLLSNEQSHEARRGESRYRSTILDAVGPVLQVINVPVQLSKELQVYIADFLSLHKTFDELRAENDRLKLMLSLQSGIALDRQESDSLNASPLTIGLQEFLPKLEAEIDARIVGDSSGSFVHSILIERGTNHGVRRNLAVISAEGLFGRVIEVSRNLSRVLLVTDYTSRVPVYVVEARVRTILAGNNTNQPRLLYIPEEHNIKQGMEVLSSGNGRIFPPGLPVGRVIINPETGELAVALYASLSRATYVKVLDYPYAEWEQE